MLLVSVGFCAGVAFYRFALESLFLKKRRKKREVDRVARRSVALREGKDAIEGETYVQCRGGEGEGAKEAEGGGEGRVREEPEDDAVDAGHGGGGSPQDGRRA